MLKLAQDTLHSFLKVNISFCVIETNLMHYLSSAYLVNISLHVSGTYIYIYIYIYGDRGSTVVKVLCYGWFDPSWCHWNFSLT